MPVAQEGYDGFQQNQRVVITGARNALMARIARLLPRTTVLRMVRNLQAPAITGA